MNKAHRRFSLGESVRVRTDSPWAAGATGRIADPDEIAVAVTGGTWERGARWLDRGDANVLYWWVVFDELQYDEDGEGPWPSGEVEDRYLEGT